MTRSLATRWAKTFGLAQSPLFGISDATPDGEHAVMLDGGAGSFGISYGAEIPNAKDTAGWAWSSDLPHHVSVSDDHVQVVRWDSLNSAELYQRDTVDKNLTEFYKFLRKDRVRSNQTVVKHLLETFSRLRSLLHDKGIEDVLSTDVFVSVLANQISDGQSVNDPNAFGLPDNARDILSSIGGSSYDALIENLHRTPHISDALKLHSSLVIRHASGQLFQEAHFDLIRTGQRDLFGSIDLSTVTKETRGGIHFTPPSLARSIVDFIFSRMDDLKTRKEITVVDPACGSGAFLHEAIRGLQRAGFKGTLKIVGQDLSKPALRMANFTLAMALRDWTPAGGASYEINLVDSLDVDFPKADVIVMNPPYISRVAQTPKQKSQLDNIVGEQAGRRGDYSMAFVTKALDALKVDGTMGVLVPTSLLRLQAAGPWREQIASSGDIDLIADIGDFSLFSEALVNAAILVVSNRKVKDANFMAMVSGNDSETTGDAFRHLRLIAGAKDVRVSDGQTWSLFTEKEENLFSAPDWKIISPSKRNLQDTIEASISTSVQDLFRVERGIETGNLKAFVLEEDEFLKLPKKERRYFRKALNTNAIRYGKIIKKRYVFYPYSENGPVFSSEDEVSQKIPSYYKRKLLPMKATLEKRAALVREGRPDWWGLNWHRSYTLERQPKILSKFFGKVGSYVLDETGELVITTGHVWLPKNERLDEIIPEALNNLEFLSSMNSDVLQAYAKLLNSSGFMNLVSLKSPTVAGGQFDLSKRFVKNIRLPDLWSKYLDPIEGEYVKRLATLNLEHEEVRANDLEHLVAKLYQVQTLVET